MRIDILTLFPAMCYAYLDESILGRARKKGAITVECENIRDYTSDKHNRVDDAPYAGTTGMVMQAQPIYDCFMALCEKRGTRPHLIYLSPQGKALTQQRALELSKMEHIALLCGHYEGIDERVIEEIVDEEVSIGDYVLTGGEIPSMILVDSITRLLDGAITSESLSSESFTDNLLDYPTYTKPRVYNNMEVPEVLLSGDHKKIDEYRLNERIRITKENRPDLWEKYNEDNR